VETYKPVFGTLILPIYSIAEMKAKADVKKEEMFDSI
jgi:hypothetical protein